MSLAFCINVAFQIFLLTYSRCESLTVPLIYVSSQVVAITVFCLLVVAFYAFFAPFLGGRIWEYVLMGVYSPVVCALSADTHIHIFLHQPLQSMGTD